MRQLKNPQAFTSASPFRLTADLVVLYRGTGHTILIFNLSKLSLALNTLAALIYINTANNFRIDTRGGPSRRPCNISLPALESHGRYRWEYADARLVYASGILLSRSGFGCTFLCRSCGRHKKLIIVEGIPRIVIQALQPKRVFT